MCGETSAILVAVAANFFICGRHLEVPTDVRHIPRCIDDKAFEHKSYCSAAFLDISQAFDKVWHISLLYKLRQSLPINYFFLLQSFLQNRHFYVRFGSAQHPLSQIHAGVPQGSVLGPFLYLIYTADLPTSPITATATFADDTAILTMDSDPAIASQKLQTHLNELYT
jgi:hypothetical protein